MPKPRPLRWLLWLSLLLSLSSCVTIQDATECSPSGDITQGGMICTHSIASWTLTLTPQESFDLLTAQPAARTCCAVPGFPYVCADDQSNCTPVSVPARGAAIIMIPADWGEKKLELDMACREDGSRCTIGAPLPNPSP